MTRVLRVERVGDIPPDSFFGSEMDDEGEGH